MRYKSLFSFVVCGEDFTIDFFLGCGYGIMKSEIWGGGRYVAGSQSATHNHIAR